VRLRRLGSGGMGVVYEAFDRRRGERVAVKALPHDDPNLLYRLKREFRSLAGLRHHNLVRLHELVADGSSVFFSMELVDGEDFVTFCRRADGPSNVDAATLRAALRQLGDGIGALHAHGQVHRDLKPGNVLVCKDGRVVIIDFGLASPIEGDDSSTLGDEVAGTAAYMAPEQTRCGGHPGPPADWYAVGVMLFEVLAGRRPFEGSLSTLCSRKQRGDAPDVFESCPHAPRDLGELCNALLRRDTGQRAGAREVARVLAASPRATGQGAARSSRGQARRAELTLLEQDAAAVCHGERRVTLVCGPTRSGKTALLEALMLALGVREHPLVLRGGCHPRERIAYRAMDPLIDQLSRVWRGLPHGEALYLLPRQPELLLKAFPVLGRVKEVRDAARPELSLTGATPEHARAACLEVLQRLARRRPLVLVVDDAHWMDSGSVSLLRALLESEVVCPIALVLALRRDVAGPAGRLAPFERGARVIEIAIPRCAGCRRGCAACRAGATP
jgi:predicted Ser/Thr protein kinase